MTITYRPKGVCSRLMRVEVEDGIIRQVEVQGGCSGNLQGISRLLVGMPVQQAIERMEGVRRQADLLPGPARQGAASGIVRREKD